MASGSIKHYWFEELTTACNIKPGRYINQYGGEEYWLVYYVAEIPVQAGHWIMVLNSSSNTDTYSKWVDINGSQVGSLIQHRNTKGWGQSYQAPQNAVMLVVSMYNEDRQPLIQYTPA